MEFEITADQFAKGMAAGERLRQRTPLAISAKYVQGRLHVELNNGRAFVFPAASAQGLAGASVASLKEIEVQGAGLGLHWPQLDADLHVPSLLKVEAIEEYEEQERKHTENVKMQRRMFYVAVAVAFLTVAQAGLIKLPTLLDLSSLFNTKP